jgi:hypothetical protein
MTSRQQQKIRWNKRETGDPNAPTETQRQVMEKCSPFLNGDAAPKKPKTLRRMKSNRFVGVVQSETLMFKVAIPCYHWAFQNGACRLNCEQWQEAGGNAKGAWGRGDRLHMQGIAS